MFPTRRHFGASTTRFGLFAALVVSLSALGAANAQVVINEVVYDSVGRFAEYVELYNAGPNAVNIGDWSVDYHPTTTFDIHDVIPSGTMLAPGGFWVLGNPSVPNVNQPLDFEGLYPDGNGIFELFDNSSNLVDALAVEINKGEYSLTADQVSQVAAGWWGNTQNYDRTFPISLGRYLDGRDTDNNGRDFGITPATPGESNGLAQTGAYSLPDVDGLSAAANDPVPGMSGSFTRPRVVDPTVVDTINLNAIPASPQGGNAIMAWDESGGGNMSFATEVVTSFDIYAYIDTAAYGAAGTTDAPGAETTTYGIGTTGSLHNFPDPTGLLFNDGASGGIANGNTGIGWVFQKEDSQSLNRLMLIDFNDGGPGNPSSADWTVLETIEMSEMDSNWYRLGIDYDPATGEVVATFGDQTFTHSTEVVDVLGTFYIGYRESIDQLTLQSRPPTFDLFVEDEGLAGDFNQDGTVDAADYTVWRDGLGTTYQQSDYDDWRANYGATTLTAPETGSVPEPAAMLLAVIVGAGFVCRRT